MKINITKEQLSKYGLLAVAAVVFVVILVLLFSPDELWVNGAEVSELADASLLAGGGRVSYDGRVLHFDSATVSENYNTAGVYCEGDLTIELTGENIIIGDSFGMLVYGDLNIVGDGTLRVWGGEVGLFVKGKVTVEENADVLSRGGSAGVTAEKGLAMGAMHRLQAGAGENSAVLAENWQNMRYVHVHAPVSLSFEGRGGSAPDAVSLPWGSAYPAIEDGRREGYYFDGWFTDSARHTLYDPAAKITDDVTLYAGWTRMVFVSFDTWGGSEMAPIDLAVGNSLAEPAPPTKVDQTFAGWYADDDLEVPYDFETPVNDDITLYAKWNKNCDAAVYGIDVSSWQRDIDWQAVADDGIKFAIMRAGFRGYGAEGTLNEDDYFRRNVEGALAAGLDVGCYFYCQSTTPQEAVEEAEYLIGLIGDYKMTLPVFLDFEVPVNDKGEEIGRLAEKKLSGEEHAAICLAFCERIEQAGFTAMVYAGKGHLYQDDMAGILDEAGYGVWLAHWRMQTNYSGRYEYWQYSATGDVSGIAGDVDMDIRYITTPQKVLGFAAQYSADEGVVSLTWERMPGVYGYIIERQDPATGQWMEIDRITGAGITAYIDDDPLVLGTLYSYRVSAYLTQSGTDYIGEASDAADVAVGTLPEPAAVPDPAALPDEDAQGEGGAENEDAPDNRGTEPADGGAQAPQTDEDNNGANADNTQEEQA